MCINLIYLSHKQHQKRDGDVNSQGITAADAGAARAAGTAGMPRERKAIVLTPYSSIVYQRV